MSSFVDVINHIKGTLEADTALAGFCTAQFGKAITVKKVFKPRIKIGLDELPLIMITTPNYTMKINPGIRLYDRFLHLYCGFHQPKLELAQDQLVQFNEKIEDALLAYHNTTIALPTGVDAINPADAANDEGFYHPVYFLMLEVKVKWSKVDISWVNR